MVWDRRVTQQRPIKQKTEPLTEVQKIILDIYKEFKRICEKNNLFYIASSGTLLGAVREGGFIPHDDDMDVSMSIDDAEKLFEVWSRETKFSYYEIKWFRGYHCLKINDSRTTNIEFASISHFDTHEGVFFDIFLFVGLPSNNAERNVFVKQIKEKRHLVAKTYFDRSKNAASRQDELYKMFKSVPPNEAKYFVEMDVFNNIYPKQKWYDVVEMKFEDTTIPVPKNYEERLVSQYGHSYRQRLPKDEQLSQHTTGCLLDLNSSYKKYSNKLKSFNAQFLQEVEYITHAHYQAFGYKSYRQGKIYELEQKVYEKDMKISSIEAELESFLSIKRSARLLIGNIKRKLMTW